MTREAIREKGHVLRHVAFFNAMYKISQHTVLRTHTNLYTQINI